MIQTIKSHKYAVLLSIIIGLVFLLPHVIIPILQEEAYYPLVVKGVDARSVDEALYAQYVKEVEEGHLIPRSNVYEWKDKLILSHAGAPFPALILGGLTFLTGSVSRTYILSYALFTFLGALLIYALAFNLTKDKVMSLVSIPLLYFSPTYILKFFSDKIVQPISYFSRFYPVLFDFPILATTFLLLFYLIKKQKWRYAIFSGILGGLLFYTYFYYWTFYVVFIISLFIFYLIKKEWSIVKKLFVSGIISVVIGAIFFLNSLETISNKEELLTRLAIDVGRYVNWKITFLAVALIIIIYGIGKKIKDETPKIQERDFLIVLLISSAAIMNVQLILNYTITPRHWLTTVIWPILVLCSIYLITLLKKVNVLQKILTRASVVVIIMLCSFGLLWQVTYALNVEGEYTLPQTQTELFTYLNEKTNQDDVVLTVSSDLIHLLPIYTKNSVYVPNANVDPLPLSEMISRRLIALKILGASSEDLLFLKSPCAFSKLLKVDFEDKKEGVYNYALFEEAFSHHITFESFFSKKSCVMPQDFVETVKKTYEKLPSKWSDLVEKYRVDYLVIGPYEESIPHRDFSLVAEKIYENEEYVVYKVKKEIS